MYKDDLRYGIYGDEAMNFVLYVRRFPFHLDTLGSQGSESHARTDVQGSITAWWTSRP